MGELSLDREPDNTVTPSVVVVVVVRLLLLLAVVDVAAVCCGVSIKIWFGSVA